MSGHRTAYGAALAILGRRDHFAAELADKLARKGFPADEVAAAVDRCRELDLIDDRRVARRFVELRAADKGWGPRRLRAELRRRGLARELVDEVVGEGEVGEEAMATALRRVEARRRPGWWRVPALRSRMVSSLVSRGFDPESALEAVESLAAERETADHDDHAFDDQPGDPGDLP